MDMTYFFTIRKSPRIFVIANIFKAACFLRHFAIKLSIVIKKEAKLNVRKFRLRSQLAPA